VKLLKFKTHSDLYFAVGTGILDPLRVREILQPQAKDEAPAAESGQKQIPKKREVRREDFIYLDQHLANINYTLASCCNPIIGDRVFGFVTVSKGISVHRVNCPNAKDLQKRYNYRIVKVKWREQVDSTSFQASVRIQGIDQVGILNTISEVISKEMETNIRAVAIETSKGLFRGTLKVYVRDTRHLEKILHRLEKLKGILKVSRVD
jgi:guanosine-3',5'-bis(diphosphate) 3'-pyrophosphohydrolase